MGGIDIKTLGAKLKTMDKGSTTYKFLKLMAKGIKATQAPNKAADAGSISASGEGNAVHLAKAAAAAREEGRSKSTQELEKLAFRAVMKDDVPALAALLQRGVNINARNPGSHTLLEMATERRRPRTAEYLQREGAFQDESTLSIKGM